MFKKTTAQREKVKLMVGLTGPSGSGKTLSALKLAYGLTKDWGKITLADTENKSALYYAGETTGPWEHVDFSCEMPNAYHPTNWVNLIEFCEADANCEVLILDSITHEWAGANGCLELVTNIGGNSYTAWKTVTPLHDKFIDKMRSTRLHIIACMRSKQEYVIEQNDKGKATPRKVGTKSVQRDGAEYEFGIILDINMNHYAEASKDRTGIFKDLGAFQITPATGEQLLAWATSGKDALYSGTASEKIAFAKACAELGVTKKESMADMSEKLVGVAPLRDLKPSIETLLKEEKQ